MTNLRVVLVLLGLATVACGGSGSSPVAPSSSRPSGAASIAAAFSAGSVPTGGARALDLSGCFGASGGPLCFSGAAAQTRVLTAGASAPGAPGTFFGAVSGSTITFTWTAPTSGDPVATYVLEAGSASGLSNLANAAIGTATSYVAGGVPAGTYYVRVRAQNAAGVSSASNEVAVTVGSSGCTSSTSVPTAPTGVTASAIGSNVTITWVAPAGCTITFYNILAGSAPGLSDLATTGGLGPTRTSFTATVGNGTFYIRVRATNNSGQGPPSNDAILVVGGPQATISNLGPGDTYQTGAGGNVFFGGPGTGGGPFTEFGIAFTPSSNTRLNTIELPMSLSSGVSSLAINLLTDNGGVPGTVLESWGDPNHDLLRSTTPAIVRFTSVLQPALSAGKQYWITASVVNPGPTDTSKWYYSVLTTPFTTARRFSPSVTWNPNINDTKPVAFRVTFLN
jgi:hypothetical protein